MHPQKQIAMLAKTILLKRGHNKGFYALNNDGQCVDCINVKDVVDNVATCCLVGAIGCATLLLKNINDAEYRDYTEHMSKLFGALKKEKDIRLDETLSMWNDEPNTTFEEVISLLETQL